MPTHGSIKQFKPRAGHLGFTLKTLLKMHYEPSLYPTSLQFYVMVYDIWHGALQTLLCSQLYSFNQCFPNHTVCLFLEQHCAHRHQPSIEEEEKFKVIETLNGKLKAIFQSASNCLALFTTLVTFIRQMEVKSSSNTSTHSTDDKVQRQQFLCLKPLHSFFSGNVFCCNHNKWCISKILYVENCNVESKTTPQGCSKLLKQTAGMKIYFLTHAHHHYLMLRYKTIYYKLSNYQYFYFRPVILNCNLNNLCINRLNTGKLPYFKTGLNDSKVSFWKFWLP